MLSQLSNGGGDTNLHPHRPVRDAPPGEASSDPRHLGSLGVLIFTGPLPRMHPATPLTFPPPRLPSGRSSRVRNVNGEAREDHDWP